MPTYTSSTWIMRPPRRCGWPLCLREPEEGEQFCEYCKTHYVGFLVYIAESEEG